MAGSLVLLGFMTNAHAHGGYSEGRFFIVPLLLVTMAIGYWVLTLSQKVERPLDKLGRFIGGFVLLVSFLGLLCSAICGICYMRSCRTGAMGAQGCSYPMKKMGCPFQASSSPAAAEEKPAEPQKAQ